jgi:hypothetical protein
MPNKKEKRIVKKESTARVVLLPRKKEDRLPFLAE